jgi:hypothetical protein
MAIKPSPETSHVKESTCSPMGKDGGCCSVGEQAIVPNQSCEGTHLHPMEKTKRCTFLGERHEIYSQADLMSRGTSSSRTFQIGDRFRQSRSAARILFAQRQTSGERTEIILGRSANVLLRAASPAFVKPRIGDLNRQVVLRFVRVGPRTGRTLRPVVAPVFLAWSDVIENPELAAVLLRTWDATART